MVIEQGDIFWVHLKKSSGSEPGFRRPFIVVQNNVFNNSNINTVVACAITSNLNLEHCPGNVRLRKGEGKIPKSSVVNITQMLTLDKMDLGKKIGSLPKHKLLLVLQGIKMLIAVRNI